MNDDDMNLLLKRSWSYRRTFFWSTIILNKINSAVYLQQKINSIVYPQQNQFCRLLDATESILSNSHDMNHYCIHKKFTLQENIFTDNYTVD